MTVIVPVFQHDIVVSVDKIYPAARQRAHIGNRRGIPLFRKRRTDGVIKTDIRRDFILVRITLFISRTDRHQRHRRVIHAQRYRGRVFLKIVGAKKRNLIADNKVNRSGAGRSSSLSKSADAFHADKGIE